VPLKGYADPVANYSATRAETRVSA